MNKFTLLCIVGFIIIVSGYLFIRPDFFGFDSYYYLSLACNENNLSSISFAEPSQLFFKNIIFGFTCNIFFLKTIHVGLAILSAIAIFFVVLETGLIKKEWYLPTFLGVLVSPVFLGEHFKFENEAWAYPLLFFGLWFLIRFIKEKTKTWKKYAFFSVSMLLFGIALVLWKGSIVFVVGIALFNPLILIGSIGIILLNFSSFVQGIFPNNPIAEQTPLIGFFQLGGLLIFGIPGIVKYFPKENKWKFVFAVSFFLFLDLLSQNFMVFAIPFLIVGTILYVERKKIATPRQTAIAFLMLGLIALYPLSVQEPTQDVWNAIDYALERTEKVNARFVLKEIQTDWQIGYFVWYKKGYSDSFGSYSAQKPFEKGWVVSKEVNCVNQDLSKQMVLVTEFGQWKVYECKR